MPNASGNAVYRDARAELERRRDSLLADQLVAIEQLPPELAQIYSRRLARIWAGKVAALAVAAALALGFVVAISRLVGLGSAIDDSTVAGALFAAWALGIGSYLAVRVWSPRGGLRRAVAGALRPAGTDVIADLDRLRRTVSSTAAEIVARLERDAVVWPLIGAAMALPLIVHYIVAAAAGGQLPSLESFGAWVVLSAGLVGHAHVVFAWAAARYGDALAGGLVSHPHRRALAATGKATLAAAIPGAVLFGIPPILTFVTGAGIAGPLFGHAHWRLARERKCSSAVTGRSDPPRPPARSRRSAQPSFSR